ncbi:MAG: alpha/beta hydrolase [Acidobacteria bacterium]|nr:alpha/beta hydrolase [Acidobacteriota bacterium]
MRPKTFEAVASQLQFLPESARQVSATGDYGDMPLVVLSASNADPIRVAEQDRVARLSSNGKHIVASNSGHWIQLEQPELVVEAIRELIKPGW